MRKIFTLYILLNSLYSFSQLNTTVFINCPGLPKVKPAEEPQKIVSIQGGLPEKVAGLNFQYVGQGVFGGTRISCDGRRHLVGDNMPLLIVNDTIKSLSFLTETNPNIIQSVTILKSVDATAKYGPDGANGIIFITTKKHTLRRLTIIDSTNQSNIPNATILFTSFENKNKKITSITDSAGIANVSDLQKGVRYRMTVSSAGYKTHEEEFEVLDNPNEKKILLARDIRACQEVVVSSTVCRRVIRCGMICYWLREESPKPVQDNFVKTKVYPNPVVRGRVVNVEVNAATNEKAVIRIAAASGQIIFSNPGSTVKGINRFSVNIDPSWPSGIYFLQVLYENGEVVASEKIIIQ